MSIPSVLTNRRVRIISGITVGIAGLALTIHSLVPVSGAYFFDQKQIEMLSSAPTFGLEMSDQDGHVVSSMYAMQNDNLLPGTNKDYVLSVKNIGTAPGNLYAVLNARHQTFGYPMPSSQLTALNYTINGSGPFQYAGDTDSYLPIVLGTLAPGEAREIDIDQSLDGMAGSEWEGAGVDDSITFNLSQS